MPKQPRVNIMKNVIKAILNQSSLTATELLDVAKYGADGGWSGFIYYTETTAFYDANEELINDLLESSKNEIYGDEINMIQMLKGFVRGSDLNYVTSSVEYNEEYEEYDLDTVPEFDCEVVHATLNLDSMEWEAVEKDTYYKNLMAWFALEEGARHIENLLENGDVEEVEAMGIDCTEWKENNE
tara:strand:- start:4064 stop:4615 length:552 start_codon:yes stop_codon:yes gene_type:complete